MKTEKAIELYLKHKNDALEDGEIVVDAHKLHKYDVDSKTINE